MSKLIPNSFQHPNFYIDKLSYFLTPQENVVLDKAIREILGWDNKIEKRQARIALSIFVDGKFNRDTGERLCYGCGIGVGAIRLALMGLDEFGILVKVGKATPVGQLFRLQDDITQIDMAALELRRETRGLERKQQTAKAREVLSDNRGTVQQHDGVLLDNRAGVLLDNNKETHEKPKRNPVVEANASTLPIAPAEPSVIPESSAALKAFERINVTRRAKGRRATKQFPTVECKQKFDTAANTLNGEFDKALKAALEQGITSVTGVTNYISKWAANLKPRHLKLGA